MKESSWPGKCFILRTDTVRNRMSITAKDDSNFIVRHICRWRPKRVTRHYPGATTLSLQLLQNCLMLINTILIQRTIDRQGLWARLQPEDFRALTPLFYGHINPYGLFELDLEGPSFLEAA